MITKKMTMKKTTMKNNFLSFVYKETLHILRDKRTLLMIILIPITLMLLFGFAISTEVNNVDVAFCSSHRTEAIMQSAYRIENNSCFSFHGFIEEDEIDPMLRSGKIQAVAVFDDDYEDVDSRPHVQIISDASDPNTSTASSMYLVNVLSGNGSRQDLFETRMMFNPMMKSSYNFVPGIMGMIFILVCALMTSVSIVREKETGTMEVLLVSPVNPVKIIFSKMIPYFLISCLTLAIILSISYFILDVPMSGGIGGIIAISLLYLILALFLGLFVSNIAKTQVAAMLFSVAVMLFPIIMFSGMIFPIENLPKIFQILSCVVPARWYIDAMRKMMIEGLPLLDVWKDAAILGFMTLVLIVGSLKKFNRKLD